MCSPQHVLLVTPEIVIEESELEERFVRSSGPGGQNVNKVATAVELRFDAGRSPALTDDIRARLRSLAGSRMTAEGVLVIDARRFRTQAQNRQDARDRLVALLRQAATRPKRRRRTKPTRASQERRIVTKKRRSETKRQRGKLRGEP
ncbi:MAG: alternative ribosome rescue aminoacyl-tRNA hydrolase ArfB [Acidobacteriota bacterium]